MSLTGDVPELQFLGIRVHPLTVDQLHERIGAAIRTGARVIVGNHNLHSIYLVHRDPSMAEFSRRADWCFVDGMGVVALGRWLGHPLHRDQRITYVDWIELLCAEAAREGWQIMHLGGRPGVGDRAARLLADRHPGLILQSISGHFDARPESPENRSVVQRINAAAPNVLLVGMGMPRQERWILDNVHDIDANAVLNCGSCMDYVAGETRTPPRWAGTLGLEWLYRLASDPRRLSHRYLVEPWFVATLAVRERRGSTGRAR